MRLWHQSLIEKLPRQQLLGQHRECCALRGLGWGRKHSTVDYVFTHPKEKLINYHQLVMAEMVKRGYKPNPKWAIKCESSQDTIYPEHNVTYLDECLLNLKNKGIVL